MRGVGLQILVLNKSGVGDGKLLPFINAGECNFLSNYEYYSNYGLIMDKEETIVYE